MAYCRAARRLRGRWVHRPYRLHIELKELAQEQSILPATQPSKAQGKHEAFAAEVIGRMDGPVLRLAERRRLLAAARGVGIRRFDANLIIAAVQHQRQSIAPPPGGSVVPAPRQSFPLGALTLVLVIEAAVAWGAWAVFFG
jgi:hypothetical protein